MNAQLSRTLIIVATILAAGLIAAAQIFGMQAKHIGSGRQSISVKGLAEKPVNADHAEWTVSTEVTAATFAEALTKLRGTQPKVRAFLSTQGFDAAVVKESEESIQPRMVEEPFGDRASERTRLVQKGFDARQSLTVATQDLEKLPLPAKRYCNSKPLVRRLVISSHCI